MLRNRSGSTSAETFFTIRHSYKYFSHHIKTRLYIIAKFLWDCDFIKNLLENTLRHITPDNTTLFAGYNTTICDTIIQSHNDKSI